MDKTRDVGRVKASRFSSTNRQIIKQSGSRTEKVKRLSFVGRVCSNNSDCEMGSIQSDGEDDFRCRNSSSSKRFKLPKKFFDECNTVEHASVPRKLRSAIKKRSPESRRLNHFSNGVELLRNDRMKKSKLKQHEELEGSSGQATVGPISKEEEEVAETLYALAGMFSDTENKIKIDSDGKSFNGKALLLPEAENSVPSSKDAEDLKMIYPTSGTVAPPQSSNLKGSGGETAEIQVSKQGTQLELPQRKQETLEFQSYIPKSNHPTVSLFSKSLLASETQTSNFAGLDCSERRWGAGLNQPLHDLNMNSGKTEEIDVESVATSRNHHDLQLAIRENKNYGSALWPGLASTGLHNAAMTGPTVKLSAAKLPAWLGIPRSTSRPCSAGNTVLTEMEPRPPAGTKKPWKKCSMHVDICRLIKELQTTDGKVGSPLQHTQFTMHGGLNQGASQASKLHLVFENGSNGVVSPYSVASSSADKSLNEINNAILLHKRLLEDQKHASISTGTYASQKQSRNFLPLPSGGCGMLAKSVADRPGNEPGQEPSTPLHLFPQNHTTMSVHLPQNHHTSYLDHHSASGASQRFQIQVPPYLSNSISGQLPSSTPMIFPKQQQQFQQFQQQQQWFLAAQLGAPHKPGESAAAPISNWQNGKHEPPPCIMQYAHQMEVVGPGPRYHPFSLQQQQQHQFISSTSFSSPRNMVQRYHHHHHHRDEGVFRPDSASSLQLLCNEQL